MIKNNKILFVLFILLCSNKCAKEGTTFHLYNNSNNRIILISRQEITDFENGYLTRTTLNERMLEKYDERYVGLLKNEMKNFKRNENEYNFYILNLRNDFSNDFVILDSIKINSNDIDFFEIENCILYDGKHATYINKN